MILDPTQIPLPPSPALKVTPSSPSPSVHCSIGEDLLTTSILLLNMSSTENTSSDIGNSIRVLEHHNYHQWKEMMQSYFLVHNLDGIVDGSEPLPSTNSSEINSWLL